MRFAASRLLFVLSGVFAAMSPAHAQYPNRAVRIIVPTSVGSGADLSSRVIAQQLSERFGHQVIVENRAGATTMIGTEIVAKSAPDGHTLLMAPPAFVINQSLFRKIPYDPLRDFAPITYVGNSPLILVVHPSLPPKSVKELIALAKARPGELVFASSGSGSITHMSAELFLYMTGTRMLHVPYKGPAPGVIDLVAGRVQLMITSAPITLPHVRTGRLRALGITGATRSAAAPDIPTIAESGVPGYESQAWYGLVAPSSTPQETMGQLNREVVGVLRMKIVRERLGNEGLETVASSAEELATYLRSEMVKWAKVVKAAGIQTQ
ncbi:MAG: tripartite tricarboxylate transporter substrate binding protein [Betaproteobacteria bacterium]|nr:tripartite tricarboxylate transporter substrate binding protein [Betaproteobacteria bacterium]